MTHDRLTQSDESSRFPLTRTDESGRERAFSFDSYAGPESVTDLNGAAWGSNPCSDHDEAEQRLYAPRRSPLWAEELHVTEAEDNR